MRKGMSTENTPQLDYQRIIGWKIWYSDKTVDSTQMTWEDAPADDVQYVMVYFEAKDALGRFTRLYSTGCDYYALDSVAGRFSSNFDDITKVSGVVKYGKYMDYNQLLDMGKIVFDDYGDWLQNQNPAVPASEDGKGT